MFSKKGFTLIELLVVVGIIAIIAGLVIVSIGEARNRAKFAKVSSNMDTIVAAAEMYYDVYGRYPYNGNPGLPPPLVEGSPNIPDPNFQKYLAIWPTPPCPGFTYDWDVCPTHDGYYPDDGKLWTPLIRISLRRIADDSAIFYKCVKYNPKSECDCNGATFRGNGEKWYCMAYQSIEEISDTKLSCSDLSDTTKFPSLRDIRGSGPLPEFTPQ